MISKDSSYNTETSFQKGGELPTAGVYSYDPQTKILEDRTNVSERIFRSTWQINVAQIE
jgi:hypothetical protein